MPTVKILKRDASAVNNAVDFNPSVFRYFIDTQEIKHDYVRSGLKSAFLGMLDSVVVNDSSLFDELSDWNFIETVNAVIQSGGNVTTINTYTGIQYIYRQAVQTIVSPAIPATLGTYTGETYRYNSIAAMFGGPLYPIETDLSIATHGIENGTFQTFNYWGGSAPIAAVTQTTNAGFYPVSGSEVGTHGQDGSDFMPLAFWNESFTPPVSNTGEYTGKLIESKTGFSLDSKKIGLALSGTNEALQRYNPIDLITFVSLIKLHYSYRDSVLVETQI